MIRELLYLTLSLGGAFVGTLALAYLVANLGWTPSKRAQPKRDVPSLMTVPGVQDGLPEVSADRATNQTQRVVWLEGNRHPVELLLMEDGTARMRQLNENLDRNSKRDIEALIQRVIEHSLSHYEERSTKMLRDTVILAVQEALAHPRNKPSSASLFGRFLSEGRDQETSDQPIPTATTSFLH